MRAGIVAFLAVAALATPVFAQQPSNKVPKDFQAFVRKFETTMNGKSADAMVALYTPDGEVVGDDGTLHSSKSGIVEFYTAIFKQLGDFKITITPIEAHRLGAGEWGIAKAEITLNRPNAQIHVNTHLAVIVAGHDANMHARMLSIGTDVKPAAPQPAATK
jgi:uncharacterized protein (TIGR02246 family)